MTRTVIPVAQLARRMVEHGRIRVGKKGTKGQPVALDTFRFTSSDRRAIDAIARIYGGEVVDFHPTPGRNEWDVTTGANEIDVYLPPDPLGNTPIYELYSGGGLLRRCDGVTCEMPSSSPDGVVMIELDCPCDAKGVMECRVVTRLNVLLPQVAFAGSWRLESKGWNAAHELPGMVDTVLALQSRGMTRAILALEKRTKKEGGKTRNFVVPTLRLPESIDDINTRGLTTSAQLLEIESAEEPVVQVPDLSDAQQDLLSAILERFTTSEAAEAVLAWASGGKRVTIDLMDDDHCRRLLERLPSFDTGELALVETATGDLKVLRVRGKV